MGLIERLVRVLPGLALVLAIHPLTAEAADPWEGVNRKVFGFNDYFDTLLVKPVATIYSNLTPPLVQRGVGNFFSNIDDINVAVNDLLQFKLEAAANDTGRVLVNSTIGIIGLFDVASNLGLAKNEEDFGQTFGYWGIPSGPFITLPTVGPSSVRDAVGLLFDGVLNPFVYSNNYSRSTTYMVEQIHDRAAVLALDELMFGDRYIFLREAYLQRRAYLVADGVITDEFDDF